MNMKKKWLITAGIILGVVASIYFALILITTSPPAHLEIVRFYGGNQSFTCTLPPTASMWFLHFDGDDVLKTEDNITVMLRNSGRHKLNVNGKALNQNGAIQIFDGSIQNLIGPMHFVEPSICSDNNGDELEFIVELKAQKEFNTPIKVTAFIRDGM